MYFKLGESGEKFFLIISLPLPLSLCFYATMSDKFARVLNLRNLYDINNNVKSTPTYYIYQINKPCTAAPYQMNFSYLRILMLLMFNIIFI